MVGDASEAEEEVPKETHRVMDGREICYASRVRTFRSCGETYTRHFLVHTDIPIMELIRTPAVRCNET